MRKQLSFLSLLLIFALFLGCGSAAVQQGAEYAPAVENRLTIYTSHKAEVYEPIVKEFEERTGIWVEVVTGGTNELLEWIAEESDAPRADVMFGGGVENLEAYKDYFLPYSSPELAAVEDCFLCADCSWTPFSANPIVLIYNTKLVDANELTSWEDLFRESFSGSIAFTDPSVSGSCYTALFTVLSVLDTPDAMSRFAHSLQGKQLDSSGAILTEVANGSALSGITIEESALKAIRSGNDIALVYPADGTSCVPDGAAILKGSDHMDNAKLFIDFILSKDVQELLVREFCRRSIRVDVDAADGLIPLASIPQVPYSISGAAASRERILSEWESSITSAKEAAK